jgi:hypothetical protein
VDAHREATQRYDGDRNAAKAAIIAFCEVMDERYCGCMYLEQSFRQIADMVRGSA